MPAAICTFARVWCVWAGRSDAKAEVNTAGRGGWGDSQTSATTEHPGRRGEARGSSRFRPSANRKSERCASSPLVSAGTGAARCRVTDQHRLQIPSTSNNSGDVASVTSAAGWHAGSVAGPETDLSSCCNVLSLPQITLLFGSRGGHSGQQSAGSRRQRSSNVGNISTYLYVEGLVDDW